MTPRLTVINGGKHRTSKTHISKHYLNVSDYRRIPVGAIITTQTAANLLPFNSRAIYSGRDVI
jgi:hypothetical protein